jgi:outer membrane protein assembly factor BamB
MKRILKLTISVMPVLLALLIIIFASGGIVLADDSSGGIEWPQFQSDEVNTGWIYNTAPVELPEIIWERFTFHSGAIGIESVPVTAGDTVYIQAGDGIWALDKHNGAILWHKNVQGHGFNQRSTPAYGDGNLFIATDDGYLMAFDADSGTELWCREVAPRGFTCPITYHEHRIYIGEGGTGGSNSYYCYSDNGSLCWQYTTSTVGYLWCGASIIGDNVVFGNVDGIITCLDKETGSLLDSLSLSSIQSDAGRIRASIAYHDGYIYATSEYAINAGYVWKIGFDPLTGSFIPGNGWQNSIGFSTSTPVIYDGRVYVGEGEHGSPGSLVCLDDASGTIEWAYEVDGGVKSSPLLSIQNNEAYIYFHTSMVDGAVYCLDNSGSLQWTINPPDTAYILQGCSMSEDSVYLGTCSGYIYCLSNFPDWDVNEDGLINMGDIVLVGLRWDEGGDPGWIRADVNRDGFINIGDITVIGLHWGD